MDLIERLTRDLTAEFGRAEIDPAGEGVLIHARGEESFDPPVRLVASDAELLAHLTALADDARDVFPDVEPLQAAYQLFLVHVDEELATHVVPGSEMRLGGDGWRTSPLRPPEDLGLRPEDGPFEFVSPEQYRERFDAAARELVAAPAGRAFLAWLVGLTGEELARAAGLPTPGAAPLVAGQGPVSRFFERRHSWRGAWRASEGEGFADDAFEAAVRQLVMAAVAGSAVAGFLEAVPDVELLRRLGEVAEGIGFGSFERWHRLAHLPERTWDPLLPVATALFESPAVSWWASHTPLAEQVAIGDEGPPPVGPVPPSALAPDEVDLRPVDRSVTTGQWWVKPWHPMILGTTRSVPGTNVPVGLVCHEDRVFPHARVGVWSYLFGDELPVFEVSRPEDWVGLVTRHQRVVAGTRRPDWRRWTGWDGDWVVPDWTSVARDWAGVHVSIAGWLLTAYRPLDVPGGRAFLAGWNPDETVWLREAPEPLAEVGEFDLPEG